MMTRWTRWRDLSDNLMCVTMNLHGTQLITDYMVVNKYIRLATCGNSAIGKRIVAMKTS